ncbi:hypothetical protein BZ164_19945 [Pseudomonas veronii]|nr:hypothetical protein BZ164_19945 [Pseudomonas veronii]
MLALLLLLEGCGLNSVRPLPAGRPIRDNSAVLVYGVGIESKWRAQLCSLQLDEYDIERQVATGNCYRFNHADAVFPGMPGPIHYFAFEVRPDAISTAPSTVAAKPMYEGKPMPRPRVA